MNHLFPHALLALAVTFSPAVGWGKPSAEEENRVFYGGLREKGHRNAEVPINGAKFEPARARPPLRYLTEKELPHADRKGSVDRERVALRVVERAGVDQDAALVSFGLPFRQGAIYQISGIRLMESSAEDAGSIPSQVHALTLWPDGSVKSALVQFRTDLKAKQERAFTVEFGSAVKGRSEKTSGVKVQRVGGRWLVNTGAIEVALSSSAFAPPGAVRSATGKRNGIAQGEGLTIVAEGGTVYNSAAGPLDSLQVERAGLLETVLRAEGALYSKEGGKLMRQISRLRFVADSAKVELTVTLVNDQLEREFTDIRSLSLGVAFPEQKGWNAEVLTGSGYLEGASLLSLSQWDERSYEIRKEGKDTEAAAGRAPGAAALQSGQNRVQFAFRDFWQRWPKGLEAKRGGFRVALLPEQEKPLEKVLPVHLQFPFVEGHYRTKWGTAFTERMVFDFAAAKTAKPEALSAVFQSPPLVVLPPDYLASTGAFVKLPSVTGDRFARWNAYVDAAMQRFLEHREEARQYGYLNWGDWYGERGRNWGNNEYDIPHGFFMQYLLTGDGKYFDAALAGVRHQADVDIVHAYPDPFYIGANLQHSIGHSGISYQKVIPKTWTYLYDYASIATNGHTWADGMADCWLLTGDPVVMESLLALGEHIRWAAVPAFKTMGNHHRSAGWSSVAAAATFRATSDPEYLEGLRKIVSLALEQWDPKTGIWPYTLHPGHAGGRTDLTGASVYNMGILLTGIARYHDLTGDPRALTAMDGAANWLLKCWSEDRAWPYAALADGSLFRKGLSPGLNPLIYPALAYIGNATGKAVYRQTAEKAFDVTFAQPIDEQLPKEFSIKMYATPWALALFETSHTAAASAPQAGPELPTSSRNQP